MTIKPRRSPAPDLPGRFTGVLVGLLAANVAVVRGAGLIYVAGAVVFALNVFGLVLPLALMRARRPDALEATA